MFELRSKNPPLFTHNTSSLLLDLEVYSIRYHGGRAGGGGAESLRAPRGGADRSAAGLVRRGAAAGARGGVGGRPARGV